MRKKPVHERDLFLYPRQYCPCCYRDTPRGRAGDCAECGFVSRTMTDTDLPPLRAPAEPWRRACGNLVLMAVVASVSGGIWYFLVLWGSWVAGADPGTAHSIAVALACLAGGVAVVAVGLVAINGGDGSDDTDLS